MSQFIHYPQNGIPTYANFASLPASAADGSVAVTLDTDNIYVFNLGTVTWVLRGSGGVGVSVVGAIDGQTKSANAAVISGSSIYMQTADASFPGQVSIGTQTFAGNKTFTGTIGASNLSGTNTGDVTLTAVGATPNANGASLSGQVLTLQPANTSFPGVLTAADWNTFNNKQSALTFGNLTDAGTDGIVVTGGTGAVIGAGTSLAQHVADATHNGYLSSADWSTFNNKQAALTFTAPLVNTANTVAINGTVADNKLNFSNASDATKLFTFDLSGQSTSTTLTLDPVNTSNMTLHIPQVATAAGAGMALVQDETTGFIFSYGISSSLGGANSMMQLANASTANRAQIKLHSYFNGASVAGVSTLTSRSGTIGTNSAVVAGQDYSKWTAQAGATTAGSAPISGTWSFKANTVNSLSVTSDFHLQLTNLAGTLGDRLYLSSEGLLQLPGYTTGVAQFDSSGNITSAAISPGSLTLTNAHIFVGNGSNVAADVAMSGDTSIVNTGAVTVNTVGGSSAANINTATINVAAGPSKLLYVDAYHPGTYTPDGSVLRPFITIGAAISQIVTNADNATKPYIIQVAPGGYNETLTFNNALFYNITIQAAGSSQAQTPNVSVGPGTGTVITSTATNTNLQNLAFNGLTLNGDIILTGDVNGTNFLGGAGVFVGCNIQKATSGILVTNVNNLYFYDCAFNSTGAGPITLTNVAFGLVEQGDGVKSGITLNLVNTGGNQPAQFAGNYLLLERTTFSCTTSIDAGSELDSVGTYYGGGTITNNGTWHAYSSLIASPIVLNNGSSFRNRGSVYSSTLTANAGSTITNQGKYAYTPTTSANWNTVPTEFAGALDTLATSGVAKSQAANLFLASPNGSSGLPSFRAFVPADIPLTSAHILVGNGSNVAADVAMSGDISIANTGATSYAGVVPIAKGGTNSSTALNNNRIIISSGGAIVEDAAITANRALASNASGIPVASTTTDTELGFVSGVTSSIQTQLNAKQSTTLTSAHILVGNGSNVATDVAMSGDISITNAGVTAYAGTVPVNKGGTGLTSGTSGGILGFTGSTTIASSAVLAANQLVLGGGAGATPTTLGSLGTTTTVLHGNAAGAPSFGAVSLTADVSGTLPIGNGGTNITTYTTGDILYASASNVLSKLPAGTNGFFLKQGASIPSWAALPAATAAYVTKTANYTLTTADQLVGFDTTSGNLVATLPTAVGNTNIFTIEKISSDMNTLTLNTTSSQTYGGRASGDLVLNFKSQYVTVQSDGANWIITNSNETGVLGFTTGDYAFTGHSDADYAQMTGNSQVFTIGLWEVKTTFFVRVGTGVTCFLYSQSGLYDANGADSGTAPTALSANVAGQTKLSNLNSTFAMPQLTGVLVPIGEITTILRADAPTTVFAVARIGFVTAGTASTIINMFAQRIGS